MTDDDLRDLLQALYRMAESVEHTVLRESQRIKQLGAQGERAWMLDIWETALDQKRRMARLLTFGSCLPYTEILPIASERRVESFH
jgi:hypothetical protein